ncbi:hypothetical protein CAPTEDRAFT_192351 [Capitella teleta]|uniref:Uncharacterized protein n=1 Tax=Capitella teleta TaxID=283909 RepID=R7T6Q1_CAPTE|nr:hypothetical protein CAPTEDRAFT_192351 [Capitella teleta]|eukprot:ELT89224.1 hypothetical protein CAPTEDRAFT_192351 [Capitella teleta]
MRKLICWETLSFTACDVRIPASDLKPIMYEFYKEKWQEQWNSEHENKLYHIQPTLGKWAKSSRDIRQEIKWKGITSLNFIKNGLFEDYSASLDGVPDQEEKAEITTLYFPLPGVRKKNCQNMAALKSHAKRHQTKVKKYTKPKRLCPFCKKKDQARLTRHPRKMHFEEEEILIEGSSFEKKEITK